MTRRIPPLAVLVAVVAPLGSQLPAQRAPSPAAARRPIDYHRDVEPILAERCVRCHGPTKQRKSLRLDHRAAILSGGRSGPAVIAGDSKRSLLISKLVGSAPGKRMPAAGPPLSDAEVGILRAWIDQGLPGPDDAGCDLRHWAYKRPRRPTVPAAGEGCARNPIDRFVAARLRAAGLRPSPAADRTTLLRRVSLDLIGLPPSIADVDRFVTDGSPGAYERAVDRLLASPRFGERWAETWLDIARYADTKGFEKDGPRAMWPWRDWVIRAFNDDMPFDEFTRDQIAGDLLPNPTLDQRLATAFHRNTMTNDEGGTDDEEWRVAAVVDRVSTTMLAWMGTTMKCVQCHEHKYDPFEHDEFYRLFAFFNNTEDADRPDERPVLPLPSREQRERLASLRGQKQHREQLLHERARALAAQEKQWRKQARARIKLAQADPLVWTAWEYSGGFAGRDGNTAYQRSFAPELAPKTVAWKPKPEWQDGKAHTVFRKAPAAHYLRRSVTADTPRRVWLMLGSDDAIKVFWNGRPVLSRFVNRAVAKDQDKVAIDVESGRNTLLIKIVNTGGAGGFYFAAKPVDLDDSVQRLLAKPAANAEEQARLHDAFIANASELAPIRDSITKIDERIASIKLTRVPILRELPPGKRRTTHVHIRGSFLNKGREVEPGVPAALHPWPAGAPKNRLGLAQWLVADDNPLTARVLVNRVWEQLFGLGIVETSDDFGTQGEPPTHPKLLDWLATGFQGSGWRFKRLVRTIVTSATYRQASRLRPELADRDPHNQLLARGPRYRLSAERIRDQALFVSGLLSDKMYGPPVMPPQPDGYWQVVYSSAKWRTSSGPDRHRRAIYTYWRRTTPYPSMAIFDAPSREVCTVRRSRTDTPLQALVGLNDPVYVEAAQSLATHAARDGGATLRSRVAHAFRCCLLRKPTTNELDRLVDLATRMRSHFEKDSKASAALAKTPELAALTVVGNVLLNLDEFLNKN